MSPVATMEGQMELSMAVLLRQRLDARVKREYERVRADALPEYTHYRDDGCEVNPSCLTCPLPRCRYEEPGGLRGLLNGYRDRQIVEMRMSGTPVEELAERFGVSRRTVFRILGANQRSLVAVGRQARLRTEEARCA